jgi:hypothetical protein
VTSYEPVPGEISHESAGTRTFAGNGMDDAKLTAITVIAAASSTRRDGGRVRERPVTREGLSRDAR